MKVIKLNGNYQGYPDWKWALQFGRPHKEKKHERAERMRYAGLFQRLHGPWLDLQADADGRPQWTRNRHWFLDAKRSRIYYRNESDLTAILLLQ